MIHADFGRIRDAPSATVRVTPSGMAIVGLVPVNGRQRATPRDMEEWS